MSAPVTSPAEPPTVATPPEATPISVRLAVGSRLLDRYELQEELPSQGGGRCWSGVRLADNVRVTLRQLPAQADTPTRLEVWQRLGRTRLPACVELLENVPTTDGRLEIWRAPAESPLTDWLALQTMEPGAVLAVVRTLAKALLALHERGLVFLQLTPEAVYLDGEGLDTVVLTRIEQCALIGKSAEAEVSLDVTRLPPEGWGQRAVKVTEALKAWDWWTLGRLAQELALGQPMIIQLVGRDLPRNSPDVLKQAEALLCESDPTGTRAGAVELMPDLPPDLTLFLRGVLTTMREARWGAGEIRAWLDGKKPVDRYLLPPGSQFVKVGEETLTPPEAGERLGREEHWSFAVEQFKTDEPAEGSPAHALIGTVTTFTTERDWFLKIREMRDAAAFRPFSVDARMEALAALAWTGVAPNGTRLRWRGRVVSAEVLQELVRDDAGMARAKVLCARTFADTLQPRDATLAWSLRTWGHEWDEADGLAVKNRWFRTGDARRRLAAWVFRGSEARNQAVQAGRDKFHLTTDAALQALFAAERPSTAQLVVLAFTLEKPEAFGFITHEAWLRMEQDRLRNRALAIVRGIQSLRTALAVRVGFPIFGGSLAWWGAAAALLAVVAVLWPGVPATLLTMGGIALAAIIRLQIAGTLRSLAPSPEGERWRWSRILPNLQALAGAANGGAGEPRIKPFEEELARVNKELTELPIQPPAAAVPLGPRPLGLWTTAAVAWFAVGGLIGVSIWQAVRHSWSQEYVAESWSGDLAKLEEAWASSTWPDLSFNMGAPKPAWPFISSGVVHPVNVLDRYDADERQFVVMKSFLLTLQEHYRPETMTGLVATEVPMPDGLGGALMVLDVATGKLASPLVFRVEQMPVRGMTIDLDGLPALYLNGP